jgi:glycosyltransferase involved in cell wall biosynthesis
VVIPCFNRSDELRRSIASVLAQTDGDFEVVVGDDASTEDLAAVVASFDDPRVRVVRRPVNGGISAGRNVAGAAARGAYLAYLDSDDEWLPQHLATLRGALDAAPADVVAVTSGFEMRFPSGRSDRRVPANGVALLDRIVRGVDLSAGSTMMIRADAMAAIGPWPEDIARNEDYDWFLRMALAGFELRVVPEVTVVIHSDDRSPLDEDALRRSHREILHRHGATLRVRGRGLERHLRAKFHEEKAWAAWRSHRRAATVGHVLAAVALDPAARAAKLSRSVARRSRHLATSPGRR